jgi:hypothetical protein
MLFPRFLVSEKKSKTAEEGTCPKKIKKHRSMSIYKVSVFTLLNGTMLLQQISGSEIKTKE